MSTEVIDLGTVPAAWTRRHLLDIESLSAEEINIILDSAVTFKEATANCRKRFRSWPAAPCANLFFEHSTRTRTSFSLAARRLGADTIDFSSSGSSLSKGETFIDTAKNIEAMGIDVVVVRHRTPGTAHLLAAKPRLLGDQRRRRTARASHAGPARHSDDPRAAAAAIAGLTVALVGDIAHSRTARSNIWGLKKLGAHVIVCGPSTLVSPRWEELGVEVAYNLDEILPRCDVLNLLRIQFERQTTRPFPSVREYALLYAMNRERLAQAKRRHPDSGARARSIAAWRSRPTWPTARIRRFWNR